MNQIEANLGKGLAGIFDDAMFHCAESLATNYWIDFVKGDSFKSLDKENKTKKGVFSGGFDLKVRD